MSRRLDQELQVGGAKLLDSSKERKPAPRMRRDRSGIWLLDWIRSRRKPRLPVIETLVTAEQNLGLRERYSVQRLAWWLSEFELRNAQKIRLVFEQWPGRIFLLYAKSVYMRAVVKEVQQLALRENAADVRRRINEIRASPYLQPIDNLRLLMRCQMVMRREMKALALIDRLLSDENVSNEDFAEAMRVCSVIGSPYHSHRVAAQWGEFSPHAFLDGYVRRIVTTLPQFQEVCEQWPPGRADASRRFLPELLVPLLCRQYRPRSDYQPGLIVQVTSSLGPGGAERQFVNAVRVLNQAADDRLLPRQPMAIVYRARRRGDLGFYLHDLLRTGVQAHEASAIDATEATEVLLHQREQTQDALNLINLLPRNAQLSVLRYYYLLMRDKPEVVQIWQDETNIQCGMAALLAGVPKIFFFTRSKRPIKFTRHRRYLRACYKDFLRLPNVTLINNSHSGAEDYANWLDLPRDRVLTVYNGIDIDAFASANTAAARDRIRKSLGIPPDAPVVGAVMRMSSEKEPLLWLEVAFRLAERHPGAHFICVGSGPLFAEMNRRVSAGPFAARIHLPGGFPVIAPWLGIMTIVLSTSNVEGLPNVPIEAQSLGIPVVATDAGGTRETFIDGETGYLCPVGEAEALVAAAERVLGDAAWRTQARARGIENCRANFDINAMRSKLLATYGIGQRD